MREDLRIGFIGNPNCGKTTLFNAFTGAKLKVANWPGVTVEKVEGAMGIIREINTFAEQMTIEFDDGKFVEYPFAQLEELELAYAVTVHKSQGSEYPAVIIPLLSGPQMLMNRNLLYTAVTRAKSCVTVVGSEAVFNQMIDNTFEQKRYTTLKERIRELVQ